MRHPLGVAAMLLASASVAAFGGAATTLSPVAPLLLRPKSAVPMRAVRQRVHLIELTAEPAETPELTDAELLSATTLDALAKPKRSPLAMLYTCAASVKRTVVNLLGVADDECDIMTPTACGGSATPQWIYMLNELQERGLGSIILLLATAVSLTLTNLASTAAWWLPFWSTPVGPMVGGHALSPRGWVNEGLMSIFFFVVGLEIKQELRLGALSSIKKALLPCIAAVGGMITPILVYLGVQKLPILAGGSLAALTVPMATDIAFAMAIFSFFRSRMPPSSSAFLLTLATVDQPVDSNFSYPRVGGRRPDAPAGRAPRARLAPTPSGAPAQQLGSSPRPRQLATGRPKEMRSPHFPPPPGRRPRRHPRPRHVLRAQRRPRLPRRRRRDHRVARVAQPPLHQ
eukprot:Transcript_3303.p1 GENE.Transcript_3303~~Transcript_3303.p1  ORF type:complete len:401 (+),score=122.47 Transcript_3303:74-1276(+)